MKEKCPLCGNDKEPTGMQLLCHPPIAEVACRKCQPGKFPYISFDVKRHDEAALKQSVWDGTGLPPVGVECEYMKYERGHNDEWHVGKIYYKSDFAVVIAQKDHVGEIVGHPVNFKFRLICSERDEAIEEMRKVVTNYNKTDVIHAIEQLYDAGYRK